MSFSVCVPARAPWRTVVQHDIYGVGDCRPLFSDLDDVSKRRPRRGGVCVFFLDVVG